MSNANSNINLDPMILIEKKDKYYDKMLISNVKWFNIEIDLFTHHINIFLTFSLLKNTKFEYSNNHLTIRMYSRKRQLTVWFKIDLKD